VQNEAKEDTESLGACHFPYDQLTMIKLYGCDGLLMCYILYIKIIRLLCVIRMVSSTPWTMSSWSSRMEQKKDGRNIIYDALYY